MIPLVLLILFGLSTLTVLEALVSLTCVVRLYLGNGGRVKISSLEINTNTLIRPSIKTVPLPQYFSSDQDWVLGC